MYVSEQTAVAAGIKVRDLSTVVNDTTYLTQAGSACYTGGARFRKVFEKAILGIAIVNASGVLLEVNESMAQLLGYRLALPI